MSCLSNNQPLSTPIGSYKLLLNRKGQRRNGSNWLRISRNWQVFGGEEAKMYKKKGYYRLVGQLVLAPA